MDKDGYADGDPCSALGGNGRCKCESVNARECCVCELAVLLLGDRGSGLVS